MMMLTPAENAVSAGKRADGGHECFVVVIVNDAKLQIWRFVHMHAAHCVAPSPTDLTFCVPFRFLSYSSLKLTWSGFALQTRMQTQFPSFSSLMHIWISILFSENWVPFCLFPPISPCLCMRSVCFPCCSLCMCDLCVSTTRSLQQDERTSWIMMCTAAERREESLSCCLSFSICVCSFGFHGEAGRMWREWGEKDPCTTRFSLQVSAVHCIGSQK